MRFYILLFTILFSFSMNNEDVLSSPIPKVQLLPLVSHSFDRPIQMISYPNAEHKKQFLLAEQGGKIYHIDHKKSVSLFLDLSTVIQATHNEEGLLSIALSPHFKKNHRLFAYLTQHKPRRTVVLEFVLKFNKTQVNPTSYEPFALLEIPQPYGNHNGGQLLFDHQGYLYLGIGDGGAGGDPYNHGQNKKTLLGSIIRVDVSQVGTMKAVTDNPFVGQKNTKPEIWAYGIRNPWRMSFDRITQALWVADVGQNRYEEVHIVQKGGNYGWKWKEASHDYRDRNASDHSQLDSQYRKTLKDPIIEYDHQQGLSITGGYVYRGTQMQALYGTYIYADFISRMIWFISAEQVTKAYQHYGVLSATSTQEKYTFPIQGQVLFESSVNISSFSEDEQGELYVLGFDGIIYRLVTI